MVIVAIFLTVAEGEDFLTTRKAVEDETLEYVVPDFFGEEMTAHRRLQEPGAIRRLEELVAELDPPAFHATEDEVHEAAKTSFSTLVHSMGLDNELTSEELQRFGEHFRDDVAALASQQHIFEEASDSVRRSLWQSVIAQSIIEAQPVVTEQSTKFQDDYNRGHGLAFKTGVSVALQHYSLRTAKKMLGLVPPEGDRRLRVLSECSDFSGLYTWAKSRHKHKDWRMPFTQDGCKVFVIPENLAKFEPAVSGWWKWAHGEARGNRLCLTGEKEAHPNKAHVPAAEVCTNLVGDRLDVWQYHRSLPDDQPKCDANCFYSNVEWDNVQWNSVEGTMCACQESCRRSAKPCEHFRYNLKDGSCFLGFENVTKSRPAHSHAVASGLPHCDNRKIFCSHHRSRTYIRDAHTYRGDLTGSRGKEFQIIFEKDSHTQRCSFVARAGSEETKGFVDESTGRIHLFGAAGYFGGQQASFGMSTGILKVVRPGYPRNSL
jgi:hypothetical protein